MNKSHSSIVYHKDENTYYASDKRSHKAQLKQQKYDDRKKRKEERYKAKVAKKQAWNDQKRKLYAFAFSEDRTHEAQANLVDSGRPVTNANLLKEIERLCKKRYNQLVKESRPFFK